MKRLILLVSILAVLLSCTGCRHENAVKRDIFHLVETNYDVILAACENKDTEALCAISGIKKVDMVDGYVIVYCEGSGIAPSSQDYGFYYSEENLPVAVFDGKILCGSSELVKEGNGYQYIDPYYNIFYTEQIKGGFYFYSASF